MASVNIGYRPQDWDQSNAFGTAGQTASVELSAETVAQMVYLGGGDTIQDANGIVVKGVSRNQELKPFDGHTLEVYSNDDDESAQVRSAERQYVHDMVSLNASDDHETFSRTDKVTGVTNSVTLWDKNSGHLRPISETTTGSTHEIYVESPEQNVNQSSKKDSNNVHIRNDEHNRVTQEYNTAIAALRAQYPDVAVANVTQLGKQVQAPVGATKPVPAGWQGAQQDEAAMLVAMQFLAVGDTYNIDWRDAQGNYHRDELDAIDPSKTPEPPKQDPPIKTADGHTITVTHHQVPATTTVSPQERNYLEGQAAAQLAHLGVGDQLSFTTKNADGSVSQLVVLGVDHSQQLGRSSVDATLADGTVVHSTYVMMYAEDTSETAAQRTAARDQSTHAMQASVVYQAQNDALAAVERQVLDASVKDMNAKYAGNSGMLAAVSALQQQWLAEPAGFHRDLFVQVGNQLVTLSKDGQFSVDKIKGDVNHELQLKTDVDAAVERLTQQMAALPASQRHDLSETVNLIQGEKWKVTLHADGSVSTKQTAQPQAGGFLGFIEGALPVLDVLSTVALFTPLGPLGAAFKIADGAGHLIDDAAHGKVGSAIADGLSLGANFVGGSLKGTLNQAAGVVRGIDGAVTGFTNGNVLGGLNALAGAVPNAMALGGGSTMLIESATQGAAAFSGLSDILQNGTSNPLRFMSDAGAVVGGSIGASADVITGSQILEAARGLGYLNGAAQSTSLAGIAAAVANVLADHSASQQQRDALTSQIELQLQSAQAMQTAQAQNVANNRDATTPQAVGDQLTQLKALVNSDVFATLSPDTQKAVQAKLNQVASLDINLDKQTYVGVGAFGGPGSMLDWAVLMPNLATYQNLAAMFGAGNGSVTDQVLKFYGELGVPGTQSDVWALSKFVIGYNPDTGGYGPKSTVGAAGFDIPYPGGIVGAGPTTNAGFYSGYAGASFDFATGKVTPFVSNLTGQVQVPEQYNNRDAPLNQTVATKTLGYIWQDNELTNGAPVPGASTIAGVSAVTGGNAYASTATTAALLAAATNDALINPKTVLGVDGKPVSTEFDVMGRTVIGAPMELGPLGVNVAGLAVEGRATFTFTADNSDKIKITLPGGSTYETTFHDVQALAQKLLQPVAEVLANLPQAIQTQNSNYLNGINGTGSPYDGAKLSAQDIAARNAAVANLDQALQQTFHTQPTLAHDPTTGAAIIPPLVGQQPVSNAQAATTGPDGNAITLQSFHDNIARDAYTTSEALTNKAQQTLDAFHQQGAVSDADYKHYYDALWSRYLNGAITSQAQKVQGGAVTAQDAQTLGHLRDMADQLNNYEIQWGFQQYLPGDSSQRLDDLVKKAVDIVNHH